MKRDVLFLSSKRFPLRGRIPNLGMKLRYIFFDMCHNSKFLETSPLEHFYVVVKHVLKSVWVILRVIFEARLKNSDFT